jgi:drug/metabolite transporter (DMT)-like permease
MPSPDAPSSARSRTLLAYAGLALVMALWAGNSIVGRAVRGEIGPFTLAFLRWAGALLVVAPFAARRLAAERGRLVAGWKPILFLGVVGVAGFNGFLYSGLRLTTATNALLVQAAIPALVLGVDRAVFRARPPALQVAGVLLSVLGVALIVARGDLSALSQAQLNLGDLLVLCGVVCWSVYTACLRLRPPVASMSFLTATFAVGAAAMLPLAIWEWRSLGAPHWSPTTILAVAYVAVLPSVVAYSLFNAAVATLGAGPAGQAINLMPVFGALLAALTLGEPLHGYHLAGMTLVLLGILFPALALVRRGAPRRHPDL